jgi:hypothetical protein
MGVCKASHQLRMRLLFRFVKELKLNMCYRCEKLIEDVSEFSIDHKDSWLASENPKETFFDMDNIAFSHRSCNSAARKQTKTIIGKCGYKGVTKDSSGKRIKIWRATIHTNSKTIEIGRYSTPE